mmetsp:Transcript_18983/g.26549  ORF Transcript_18983/g.26549 Transcript_18983/m.26549 type:complete len:188 (+) Transcript_18983:166-729(+)
MPQTKYNLVVVGDGGVGKSCITLQYVHNKFVENYDPTVEDSYRKQITFKKKSVLLDICDTAGQEMYLAFQDQYYKSAIGFLLVYSVVSKKSFDKVTSFKERIVRVKEAQNDANYTIVLVGNKIDLKNEREVSTEEGASMAKSLGAQFIETSAKTREKIDDAFNLVVQDIMEREKNSDDKKKGKCTIL